VPATGITKRELEAAATNYYMTMNRAYATLDDKLPLPLSVPACSCRGPLANIREAASRKYKINLVYQIIGVSAHSAAGGKGGVTLSYNLRENTVEDQTGKVVERYPLVRDGIKEMSFINQNGKWLVTNIITYN
jgi:hypothetical protein